MCGICGEIRFDKSSISEITAKSMINAISRRGPDNEDSFFDQGVFLGHRRLSVIDISDKSHQPMVDNNLKLAIVFNGVIYNYKELRNKLKKLGYSFFSDGDTEVILKSYHHYGSDCVKHFDGVFAFCIYDIKLKKFFLSRDRLGIKPLYYKSTNNNFSFSSNTKALINNGKHKIDKTSLHYQFTLHSVIPSPNTILENIKKLEPGHSIIVDFEGKIKKEKYYSFEGLKINYKISEEETLEEIERLLVEAIRKRLLTSDVPVGVLLSGGLDSSLIVAMAAKNNLLDINTFSIGFPSIGSEHGDEFYYSDKVSKQFNTNHHKHVLDEFNLYDSLDNVISMMPEPMVSQDSAAFFLLAKKVSQVQKVVLSGQGADELFGGYFWYKQMNNSKGSNYKKFSDNYFDRNHDDFCKTITKSYQTKNHSMQLVNRLFDEQDDELNFLDKVFRIDISTLIIDDPVKRIDSMTMAWGLETRVPFLDINLVEFMLTIQSSEKIKYEGKYHLKKIAEKYLTDELINREKYYFPVPPIKILQDKFYEYVKDILLSPQCKSRGLFNNDNIQMLLNNPNKYFTKLNGNKLWHLALLERWLQMNVDGV